MLKLEQAQQLLDLNAITPDQYSRLTSPDPTQTLDFLPDTTPEQRLEWDAQNQLAQERDAQIPQGMKDPGVVVAYGQPKTVPISELELIEKARQINLNKKAEAQLARETEMQSDPAVIQQARAAAGLSYDPSVFKQPAKLSTGVDPNTPIKTKDPLAGIYSAFDKEQKANLEIAKTAEKQALAESTYMDTMVKEQERLMEENQAREAARQQKLDEQMSVLNQKLDDYDKSPATVGQMFANKSTGGKILGAIALFLGSAPDGTAQNSALQVMQASVDADLAKQKSGIAGAKGVYNDLLATFGDQRQAEAGARLAYLNNAQLKLNQIASQYKGEMVQKNAILANAKIEQQKQALKMQFAQASGPKVASTDQTTQLIYANVPKELQGKALEESGFLEELELDKKTIKDAFQKIKATSLAGNLNPFSKSEAAEDSAKAIILPTVMKVLASRGMTNPDVMKGLKNLKPSEFDTEAQVDAKMDQIIAILESSAKPTPILTRFGAKPIPAEQTYNFTQRKK